MAGQIKRSRNGAKGVPKVKTGCRTCKIRRKKCDELKPACSQCVSTKRSCDFLTLPRPLRQKAFSDFGDIEVLHFDYFKTVCTREFSLYFEDPFWEKIVFQASLTEPCIQHAALTIGALSRSQYQISVPRRAVFEYSMMQYNLAIQALGERLDSDSTCELAVLAGLIFIAIEMLQGHENRADALLRSSFALLKRRPYDEMEYLSTALSRIESQLLAFGNLFHLCDADGYSSLARAILMQNYDIQWFLMPEEELRPHYSAEDTLGPISILFNGLHPACVRIKKDFPTMAPSSVRTSYFPDEVLEADAWSRGTPSSEIKRLSRYWAAEFDWRQAEMKLNAFPQFMAPIEVKGFGSYDVHFIHQLSTNDNAIPLLFLHGWPGSFIEVTKILPHLIQGGKDFPALHVVAPSLIGFGFSSAGKPGFNVDQHAEAYHNLMQCLGYAQYVVQGGDFGYLIARFIVSKYGPEHCRAHHVNSTAPAEPTAISHPDLYAKIKDAPLSEGDMAGLGRTMEFSKKGNGYLRQLSTKPQTIAFSLTDSPIGLLAWIYEKLNDWTDDYPWTDDEVLTWVSIHYFSRAGPAAANSLYFEIEYREPGAFAAAQTYFDVPLGISRFSKDLILLPKLWNQTMGPIVFEREHESGGHFAAWERPNELVQDLRLMFGKGSKTFHCVDGKNGYRE